MELRPGQTIGQYLIKAKVGEGGMGAVYVGEQTAIHRPVAIKVLTANFAADHDALDRFKREVDIIAQLEHPHILPVYDFGQVDGNPYIVMRFMGGGSLREALRSGAMSPEQLLRVLGQVADALDYAHNRDIIHRDLKPANVLLDESGNAYLADFGLAKTMEGSRDLTATGSILGTPAYMSPEQARGERLDRRSDVYAFGILVYEALAGQLPFTAETAMGYIEKHLTEVPRSIRAFAPSVPAEADRLLATALSKDRALRPSQAGLLMQSLRAALAGADGGLGVGEGAPAAPSTHLAAGWTGGPTGQRGTARRSLAPTERDAPRAPGAPALARPRAAARPSAAVWAVPAVLLAGLGLVIVAVLVVVGLLALQGNLGGLGGLGGPRVQSYPVGDSPRALVYDGAAIWSASFFANTVTRLEASACAAANDPCGRPLNTLVVDDLPVALAYDAPAGRLWVASALNMTLTQLERDGQPVNTLRLPSVPSALLLAGEHLWTANAFGNSVTKLSREPAVIETYPVGQAPVALAFDGATLWVANQDDSTLVQLDPASGAVLKTHPAGGQPAALAYDGQHIWVALADRGVVAEVDPANGSVMATVPVGERPVALLYDGASLWSANQAGNSVTRIDVRRARAEQTVEIPGGPYALAWAPCGDGCGDLWVANEAADLVSRVRFE
jgi:serine/threonine-protein kinase